MEPILARFHSSLPRTKNERAFARTLTPACAAKLPTIIPLSFVGKGVAGEQVRQRFYDAISQVCAN